MLCLVAHRANNQSAMQETWVQSLGQEDPLERGMATHCSILAWRIPWTEEPGGLQCIWSQRVRHDRSDTGNKGEAQRSHWRFAGINPAERGGGGRGSLPSCRPHPLTPRQLGGLYSPGEPFSPRLGCLVAEPQEARPRLRCQGHRSGLGKSRAWPL